MNQKDSIQGIKEITELLKLGVLNSKVKEKVFTDRVLKQSEKALFLLLKNMCLES